MTKFADSHYVRDVHHPQVRQVGVGHKIRMETEAKANNPRLFLGEIGGPLLLCIADELT